MITNTTIGSTVKGDKMIRKQDLTRELSLLEDYLQATRTELTQLKAIAPNGAKLRAIKHGNGFQFFLRHKGSDSNGEYLKKEKRGIAATLAQIEYDEKLSVLLHNAIEAMKKNSPSQGTTLFEEALCQMSPAKRVLVAPPYVSDQDFLHKWIDQSYEQFPFKEDAPAFYTRQGLRVRSKSEVIIADILDEMSVPFLYEKPLRLGSETVHPDFTLMNLRNRRELYWEHFGIMDDMDYRNNAFLKIRNYESNGLYPYVSVIWTFETGTYPLNTKELRKMVKELKRELGYD